MRIKIHSAFTFHCNSKVPKKYKRNEINTDHFRSMRIASDMEKEIKVVKEKFTRAGLPVRSCANSTRKRREERDQHERSCATDLCVRLRNLYCIIPNKISQTTVSHIKEREILHKITFFSQLEKKQRQNQIISDSLNSFTKYLLL